MKAKHILIILFCVITDQAYKYYMLDIYNIAEKGKVEISNFFNLVLVWNRGVSFGMFQNNEYSNIFFFCFSSFVVVFILFLIKQSSQNFEKLFLTIIAGGAIGNIIDRIRLGAVADFFDFHYAGFHWPAFNFADSFVFIGAFGLISYTLFYGKKDEK